MKKNMFLLIPVCFGIFLGMVHPKGGSQGDPVAGPVSILAEEEKLQIRVKALNSEESRQHWKKDLIEEGVYPVAISVENHSVHPYAFGVEEVSLSVEEPKTVAKTFFRSALPRSICFRVAALFFWPLNIPAGIDSILTNKRYRKLRKKLEAGALKQEVIPPYSCVRRVFFVRSEMADRKFTIVLENTDTLEKKTFSFDRLDSYIEMQSDPVSSEEENVYLGREG